MAQPTLTIFAGPNGSGKSTLKQHLAEAGTKLGPYINADEIADEMYETAKKKDPDAVRAVFEIPAFHEAATRRNLYIAAGSSFAFETVFSHESKVQLLDLAKKRGFYVRLYFVSTANPAINLARVQRRVSVGGHPVPLHKIVTRYYRSMSLLPAASLLADETVLFDNSRGPMRPVARLNRRASIGEQFELLRPSPAWARAWNIAMADLLGE